MSAPPTTEYFRIVNFERFQHYTDRSPPWIKLYNSLLEDYDFARLKDFQKAHLACLWLLASRTDNKIPNNPTWIANKINATEPVDLELFVSLGWLAPWVSKKAKGKHEDWPSRYISPKTREEVMARDGYACTECGATHNLEIDHIVPVSHGGTSEPSNLRVLCRSCNRKKRAKSTSTNTLESTEQLATQVRSPEGEQRESRAEGEESRGEKKELSPGNLFTALKLNNGHDYEISTQEVSEWKAMYPLVDVEQQLRNMKGWCKTHATQRKTIRGIGRFINGWLTREQSKPVKKTKMQRAFNAVKESNQ